MRSGNRLTGYPVMNQSPSGFRYHKTGVGRVEFINAARKKINE